MQWHHHIYDGVIRQGEDEDEEVSMPLAARPAAFSLKTL
jgi:hypothetical protein